METDSQIAWTVPEGDGGNVVERVRRVLRSTRSGRALLHPRVTVTYAQSLDGCIAADTGTSTTISNRSSMILWHRLRASHDGILVGVNTVLIDDPQLDVRVGPGDSPRPIILDSRLRIPPNSRVLQRRGNLPIVATTEEASEERASRLSDAGVQVLRVPPNCRGRVDLTHVWKQLHSLGIRSLMIEGGANVITSVLIDELADQLVIAISPCVLGGVRAVEPLREVHPQLRPRLAHTYYESLAGDLIFHGVFERSR